MTDAVVVGGKLVQTRSSWRMTIRLRNVSQLLSRTAFTLLSMSHTTLNSSGLKGILKLHQSLLLYLE